jgi:hypothetical protein
MMMNVEQSVEWQLAGETEVLGENLTQCQFVHHKSLGSNPGRRGGKPATNRLIYGMAPNGSQWLCSHYALHTPGTFR